jgi:heme oxygenase
MIPLKEATSEKHKLAERMPFNVKMFKGLLSKEDYLLYLVQQLQIFEAIEKKGLPDMNLARVSPVQADINELTNQGCTSTQVLESSRKYAEYLNSLTYEQTLPHVYLNYLAIMFGGQMMKKSVPSAGKMYDFDNIQQAIGAVRAVQKDEWADEVNKGFDFIIEMFDELDKSLIQQD